MLRIRRIYDEVLPLNKDTLRQVKDLLRSRFSEVAEEEIEQVGEKLSNPFKQRLRSILFVAENIRNKVLGFAVLLHEPQIGFCYLDWIASLREKSSGGIGGALYERVRQEAAALGVKGLFFECLPDEAEACPDDNLLRQNRARLRFYERYGARPIVNTAYETPVSAGDTCMPFLVYDGIGTEKPLNRTFARQVARAILEKKYANYCPPDYVQKVVESLRDNPVRLREFRYVKPAAVVATVKGRSTEQIALVVNDRHTIHHIHEHGYVESPVRVRSILAELEKSGLCDQIKPRVFPDKPIYAVHDVDFVHYIRRACQEVPDSKSLYPYIFPIRNKTRPPKERSVLSGYYCIDTFTPLNRNAYPAARRGVDCALTAAREIIEGRRIAYALVRPPGHHAERRAFGGFCYFNNNAIVAEYLCNYGRVAILDIDYHHGNGQQDIFYRRPDVLTVSIHGHPSFAYPYFSGFKEDTGEGEGEGFNLNLPLPESIDGNRYRKTLSQALQRVADFAPDFLVVALGFDTAKADPTGTWSLTARDFESNGRLIGELGLPIVVVQEGGYRTRTLGTNARRFLYGMAAASYHAIFRRPSRQERFHGLKLRREISAPDVERIRRLVEITGFFSPAEIEMACELANEHLARGVASGYHFLLGEHYGRLAGYTCYGPVPATASSYDLYWIAVHPDYQGKGVGRRLLKETERLIREAGGTRVYVDTSMRVQYASTRAFYEGCGYRVESVLDDFYAPGEAKAVYRKSI
ncbi:MAG: GNAT family N-acetyltransferase [Desulfobacterales bacterium]|nr:MAG: GNAT family N-acetyltransferase [Desulfobacterales bacterium]